MNHKILVIEDDRHIAELIEIHLRDKGYETLLKSNGREGFESALHSDFDLIILDVKLPEMNGLEICRKLREHKDTPILMLTSLSEEDNKIEGLETGADDYMTKPFSIRELMTRVMALLRRASSSAADKPAEGLLSYAHFILDTNNRTVTGKSGVLELTRKEFDLLHLFLAHPGKAFSRSELLSLIWGYDFEGYEHTVNSHMNRLRNKIEEDPSHPVFLKTVWGFGYKLNEEFVRNEIL